jgi:tRNA threonylcarbamoyladenosine modification (KEOPS) complex  Pcc1 subunit
VNHSRERLSASDAAKLLNVTPEAVRQRIRRGTIEYERTEDGRYFVYVTPSEDVSALRASFEAALEGRRGELAV